VAFLDSSILSRDYGIIVAPRRDLASASVKMLFFRFCPHWPGHRLQLPRDSNTSVYSATSYSSSAPAVSLCCPRFDYIRRRGILVRMHRGKSPPPGYPVGREGGGAEKKKRKKKPPKLLPLYFPHKKVGRSSKGSFPFLFLLSPALVSIGRCEQRLANNI